MVSGFVMLRECPGRYELFMAEGAGDVLWRFEGLATCCAWGKGIIVGTMFWSCVLILGSSRGPCVLMTGDRDGVVLLVLVVAMEFGGDDADAASIVYMVDAVEEARE